jgi:hypothetical protein
MSETICITGMGVVSAYGAGTDAFVDGYARGESGARALTLFDSPHYERREAAEVRDFDPAAMFGKRALKAYDRVSLLLLGAAELLYADAGLGDVEARRAQFADDQVGMVVGTFGSLRSVSDFDLETVHAPEYVTPTQFPNAVMCAAASYVAIRKSIRESCITLTNGEPSSLQSFALGIDRLLQGRAKQVLVGGAEELTEIYALSVQAAYSARGKRSPVLGEGAAVFTLETRETAVGRGAPELAWVLAVSSCFCPNVQEAYEHNIARIRTLVGDEPLRGVSHLFSAQKAQVNELGPLGAGDVLVHTLYPRFGYVGSATGGLAVAAMLADEHIPPGSLVLVNNVSEEGNASSVLLRKMRHARRAAA